MTHDALWLQGFFTFKSCSFLTTPCWKCKEKDILDFKFLFSINPKPNLAGIVCIKTFSGEIWNNPAEMKQKHKLQDRTGLLAFYTEAVIEHRSAISPQSFPKNSASCSFCNCSIAACTSDPGWIWLVLVKRKCQHSLWLAEPCALQELPPNLFSDRDTLGNSQ